VASGADHRRSARGGPKRDLLNALYGIRWDPDIDLSSTWKDLACIVAEGGDIVRAGEIARSVRNPYSVIGMRIDRRFDAVPQDAPFDLAAVKRAWLDNASERVAQRPRALARVVTLVRALKAAGRPEEAVDVAVPRGLSAARQDDRAPEPDLPARPSG